MKSYPVKTPCVGICSTGIGDQVCRGCKRYAHEVIDWNSYSNHQKQLVWQRIDELTTQVLATYLFIQDEQTLKQALISHHIPFAQECSPWLWALQLLRAVHKSMQSCDTLSLCGIEVLSSYLNWSPTEIYEQANIRILDLSTAYFDATIARHALNSAEPA